MFCKKNRSMQHVIDYDHHFYGSKHMLSRPKSISTLYNLYRIELKIKLFLKAYEQLNLYPKTFSTKRILHSCDILFIYMIITYDINLSLDRLCQGCQSVGTSCFLSCNRYGECILIILYTVH